MVGVGVGGRCSWLGRPTDFRDDSGLYRRWRWEVGGGVDVVGSVGLQTLGMTVDCTDDGDGRWGGGGRCRWLGRPTYFKDESGLYR